MGKDSQEYGDVVYRYVLSLMDVFSRFVWLRPLVKKSSSHIAAYLREIYAETGPPRIVQSDRGNEFRGAVLKLLREMNIKAIKSSPYHPESQGKVERSHSSFRKKIRFDMFRMKKME
jgi:transposase InsO family protein